MKKAIQFLLALSFLTSCVSAQAPDPGALLNLWGKRNPIEKIYLHIDRDKFAAGETAWFKAYLYADQLPNTASTVLYVELLDNRSALLARKILPVFMGTTNGQVEIPDTLTSGAYLLRAYTPTMLNHKPEFIYTRHIVVHGKENRENKTDESPVRLQFFPEGGNLVAGVNNTLAFKATDEKGLPLPAKGEIRNERNDLMATFSAYHDGMGITEFIPGKGERYHAVIENDVKGKRYTLPEVTDNAIALSMMPHPSGFFFEVRQQAAQPSKKVAFMLGQMRHQVVFRQQFRQQPDVLEGVIDTRSLSSGIMQVTFFNKQGLPLAERLCFVNNGEYIKDAELISDTLNVEPRSRNRFSIAMKDTVQGSISVSVTDADIVGAPEMDEHIASRLLLQGDLPGYIHHPAYYFSAKNDSVTTAADLLMMTHGWRRFNWATLEHESTVPLAYKDPGYITLSGKATLRDSNKPLSNKSLVVFISAGDTARMVETVTTDKQGNFSLDSLLFFGKSRVLYSDNRGKQSLFIDIHPNPDSLTRKYNGLPSPFAPAFLYQSKNQKEWQQVYDEIVQANGLMLEGITVKVKKKSPLQEVEDEYTSGAFSGDARKSFDLVNSDEGNHYSTVYQFLEAKGYLPNTRNIPQASAMGAFSTNIFMDEFPTDIDLQLMPLNQVALIKVFSNFSGDWGSAPGGVIAIYTKKGEKMTTGSIKGAMVHYPGFSIVKEFYAPDYRKPVEDKTGDHRITLDWRPDIQVSSINPRIPFSFYNNDRTRRFRVVVQGMTVDGKFIYIDRVIGPGSKGF